MRHEDQSGTVCFEFIPLHQTLDSMSYRSISTSTHQLGMFSHTLISTRAHTRLYGAYQYNIGENHLLLLKPIFNHSLTGICMSKDALVGA